MATQTTTAIRENQTVDRTLSSTATAAKTADNDQIATNSLTPAVTAEQTVVQEPTAAKNTIPNGNRRPYISDRRSHSRAGKQPSYVPPSPYVPKPPFPQRLMKTVYDSKLKTFMDRMSKVYINIPLIETIREMPGYAIFFKDMVTHKRRIQEHDTVNLFEECSTIIQKKMPKKRKDPGCFIISHHRRAEVWESAM